MLPTREEAKRLLQEGEYCNPGPWGNHSRIAGDCAQKIAQACGNLDSEKAYVLGLLHDIGRNLSSPLGQRYGSTPDRTFSPGQETADYETVKGNGVYAANCSSAGQQGGFHFFR